MIPKYEQFHYFETLVLVKTSKARDVRTLFEIGLSVQAVRAYCRHTKKRVNALAKPGVQSCQRVL